MGTDSGSAYTFKAAICESMVMTDSGGDGWNGAFYTIKSSIANGIEANGTLAEGSNGDDVVCLSGGTYTLEVSGGTADSEIEWKLGALAGGAPYGPVDLVVSSGFFFEPCDTGSARDPDTLVCQPCAPGNFGRGGGDLVISCEKCAADTFAPGSGLSSCFSCSNGTISAPGSPACSPCPPGYYAVDETPGNTTCTPCASGTFSLAGIFCLDCGPGSSTDDSVQCTSCEAGKFSGGPRNVQCDDCPPGKFSNPGATECSSCLKGTFDNESGADFCDPCQSPLTTKGTGSTSCDACIEDYFWNSLYWPNDFDQKLGRNGAQCVGCCMRCEDICDVDDEDCVVCDRDGSVLETLVVKRGWWRVTRTSLTVYECPLDKSCRGGSSVDDSERCFQGHFGALCGACRKGYDFDIARNRCARCIGAGDMLIRAGFLLLQVALVCAFLLLLCKWLFPNVSLRTIFFFLMKENALDGVGAETEMNVVNDAEDEQKDDAQQAQEAQSDADEDNQEKRHLRRSVLTKLKIIVAACQIASSTDEVFRQVRFHRFLKR